MRGENLNSPQKGRPKRSLRIPMHPRSFHQPSCSVLSPAQNQRRISCLIHRDVAKKLEEVWNSIAEDDKQPYEKKAAKLKDRYEKGIAIYRAKGKPGAAKRKWSRPKRTRKGRRGGSMMWVRKRRKMR